MSRTRTLQQERRYDHIYDPVYTVAGQRDHYRVLQSSTMSQLERVPDSANMFSEVSNYPRHSYRFKSKDELPMHVERTYQPRTNQADGAAMETLVAGTNRHKYFKRPIAPFLQGVPAEVMLAPVAEAERNPLVPPSEPVLGGKRAVGIQTQFRESEAQTDPYTPDYVVAPGQRPEVLTLATLTAAHGLPAGLAEVEMIERAREKRAFERALPPMTDEASFELRRRMMQEQEMREWRARESEIDRVQADRLRLVKHSLRERDREAELLAEERVEALRQRHMQKKERAIVAIQRRRIQTLRKLGKERQRDLQRTAQAGAAAPARSRRDIIAEYADRGSKVYAPVARQGQHPDRNAERHEVRPQDLSTVGGLAELEHALPRHMTSLAPRRPQQQGPLTAEQRQEAKVAQHLHRVHEHLEKQAAAAATATAGGSATAAAPEVAMPDWRRTPERVVRPPTPTVPSAAGEERTLALLLLQRLLRGRAVQNLMFEGKSKRLELIRELREWELSAAARAAEEAAAEAAAAAAEAEDLPADGDADALARQLHRTDEHARGAKQAVDSAVDTAQGEVVAGTLDLLAKELVRAQAEQRVSEFVRRAEAERRRREAEERGRRQAEAELRQRGDEAFRQVMGVHQRTADSLVEAVMSGMVQQVALEQAGQECSVDAQVLAPAVAQTEEGGNGAEVVVRDLVASFLLPEVERLRVQRMVQAEERRFVHAAHQAIYHVVSSQVPEDSPAAAQQPSGTEPDDA